MHKYIILCLLFFCNCSQTKKTLVILDDWHSIDTHSQFWRQLRETGFEPIFKMADDNSLTFASYGEYKYDNIILFAPSYEEKAKNDVTISNLLKFIDDGKDLMILGNKDSAKFLRNLVNEFGVDYDDYDSQVKDSLYLHNLKEQLHPDLIKMLNDGIIPTKNIINIPKLFKRPQKHILYEGIGMDLDPQNKYIFPILKADDTSYSINTQTGEVYTNGERIKLVSGYQARNNRRVIISGSSNICSDKLYYLSNIGEEMDIAKSPNARFCKDLLNWNFQKTGVLKFENVRHNKKDGNTASQYRIKDYLEYYIDIYEYDNINDSWKNYIADDLQLSFDMMNPYYINQMRRLSYDKPTYYAKFRAPDKHGVFKFNVDYHKVGYSYIFSSTKIPLRPFYHNEFPRFLPCAYPYYVTVFMSLFGFVLFTLLFLYGKEK